MLELHITGRQGAQLAPEHVRQILTAPTTEFKAISFVEVLAALVRALILRSRSPRWPGWLTVGVTTACAAIYVFGYGPG